MISNGGDGGNGLRTGCCLARKPWAVNMEVGLAGKALRDLGWLRRGVEECSDS